MNFKLAVIQFEPSLGNPDETIARLRPLLEQAAGADLLVLTELANSGYNFRDFDQAYELSEIPEKSAFVDFLVSQSAQFDFSLVTGFNERSVDQIYNSALLLDGSGIKGKYRKLQLFMNEKDYFQPGDLQPEIFDVKGVKVGMLVCFDWVFPELWGGLARRGADIICHPSNLVLPGKAQKAIPVWAMVNKVFIATANRTGTEGNLTFTGNSIIAGPSGEVLASASQNRQEVLFADCDISLARDKMMTPKNHVFDDRKPQFYG
jgi:predicted amidohydrolase